MGSSASLQRRLQRLQRARSVKSVTATVPNNAANDGSADKVATITNNGGLKQKPPLQTIGNEARKVSSEGKGPSINNVRFKNSRTSFINAHSAYLG